jgi:hypothetical protein
METERINFIQTLDYNGDVKSTEITSNVGNIDELKSALANVIITKKIRAIKNTVENKSKCIKNKVNKRRTKNKLAKKSRKNEK